MGKAKINYEIRARIIEMDRDQRLSIREIAKRLNIGIQLYKEHVSKVKRMKLAEGN